MSGSGGRAAPATLLCEFSRRCDMNPTAVLLLLLPLASAWAPTRAARARCAHARMSMSPEASQKIAKLEDTLQNLKADGYPAEVLATLEQEIQKLKADLSGEESARLPAPSSMDTAFVRPWTPDGDAAEVAPAPVPAPAPPPPTAPAPRLVSGMNKLRQQSEEGYVVPQPMAPRGLEPSVFDKLRARINKWTPEQAAADVARRAEEARQVAEFEAKEKALYAQRLADELDARKKTFAAEALAGAIKRAKKAVVANADIYEWSGSGRRKAIRESTDKMLEEVQTRLEEVEEVGIEPKLFGEAQEMLQVLQKARASFDD